MSAYLIDPHKALVIAVWAHRASGKPSIPDPAEAFEAMRHVWQTNVRSLQERYPGDLEHGLRHDMVFWEPKEAPRYTVRSADDAPTKIERVTDGLILAASEIKPSVAWWVAREADYQCCEFDGYRETLGGKLIDAAIYQAGRSMAGESEAGWPDVELKDSGAISLSSLIRQRTKRAS